MDIGNIGDILSFEKKVSVQFSQFKLFTEYIFLNTIERELFSTHKNYLFLKSFETISTSIDKKKDFSITNLDFNTCSRYIFWFLQTPENPWGDDTIDNVKDNAFQIILDHENIANKMGTGLFKFCQFWSRFLNYEKDSRFYAYSFALYPTITQPSSFLDFKNFKSKIMVTDHRSIRKNCILHVISCGFKLIMIENGYVVEKSV